MTELATRTRSAVFEDSGQAVQVLEFGGSDKRRAADRCTAAAALAVLFDVTTIRHTVLATSSNSEQYAGLNGYRQISRHTRQMDVAGAPDEVARYLSALPRVLAELEKQATAGARVMGAWLRTADGQATAESIGKDGVQALRRMFRADVYRRLVHLVLDAPAGPGHVDPARPLRHQAQVVAERIAWEAPVDAQYLVDADEAAAIVAAWHVVPLDETADSDDTRAVLAAAGDIVDAAAADEDLAAETATMESVPTGPATPPGLTVELSGMVRGERWAADCVRCTGNPLKVTADYEDPADALAAAWIHYDERHRSVDDALSADECARAAAIVWSDAQDTVMFAASQGLLTEDGKGFYYNSWATDRPVVVARARVVTLVYAGLLSVRAEGGRRTFVPTARGRVDRRLVSMAIRQEVVDYAPADNTYDVPAARVRAYPYLSAGHPVDAWAEQRAAKAAAVVVPDTVDEVLAAAGDQAPVDVVDAAAGEHAPQLVAVGASTAVGELPPPAAIRSIRRVENDTTTEGAPDMADDLPAMTGPQAKAYAHIRTHGALISRQGVDRRVVAALQEMGLVTLIGRGPIWIAKPVESDQAPGPGPRAEPPAGGPVPAGELSSLAPACSVQHVGNDSNAGRNPATMYDLPKLSPTQSAVFAALRRQSTIAAGQKLDGRAVNRRTVEALVRHNLAIWTDRGTTWSVKLAAPGLAIEEAPAAEQAPAPRVLLDPVTEFAAAAAANEAPPAAVRPLPNEARALVNATLPNAQDFEPVYLADGTYQGYTFQDGEEYGALDAKGWALAGPYSQRAEAVAALTYGAQVAAATAAFPNAHGFQPAFDGQARKIGTTFRLRHGAAAAYSYVTLDAQTDPHVQCVYRTAAERTLAKLHPSTTPAPTTRGSLPKHADNPLVRAALTVFEGLDAADLTDEGHEEAYTNGVMVEPRDADRIAAYWVKGNRVTGLNGKAFAADLKNLAARLDAAGWTVEQGTDMCVFATAPRPLTVKQAREAVQMTWPLAQEFQPFRDADAARTFLGYTFKIDGSGAARYGWITAAGKYGKGSEPYRSEAERLLPMAHRDDVRAAAQKTQRQAARTAPADMARPAPVTARVDDEQAPAQVRPRMVPRSWDGPVAQCGFGDHDGPLAVDGLMGTHRMGDGWLNRCPGMGKPPKQADPATPVRQENVTYDVPALPADIPPFNGPAGWDGLVGICAYDDHRAPLGADGRIGIHHLDAETWPMECSGSGRPPRQNVDEPTQQDTDSVQSHPVDAAQRAAGIRAGDQIRPVPDRPAITVTQVGPHPFTPDWLHVATVETWPFTLRPTDLVVHETRVRSHDVPCKLCGVVVVAEVDEVTEGRPTLRVCGHCANRDGQTTA